MTISDKDLTSQGGADDDSLDIVLAPVTSPVLMQPSGFIRN